MSLLPEKGDSQASKQRLIFCAKQGLFKHAISEQLGGKGDNYTDLVIAHEAIGKSALDNGLILSINAHLWGSVFPLIHYGTTEQQQLYLEKLISAEFIGGHAITEPQAGSDLNALEMAAEHTDKGIILNGHKRFITNTPIADILIIYAKLDNKLSAFIVHAQDKGAHFKQTPEVSGCKTATMGDVILENCLISVDRQLGKTGAGSMMIQQALELERAFIFAGICGVMDWQLKQVIQFSRQRRVNNSHLGKNQAISIVLQK